MAKAYWVACYRSISNPDALAAYAKLAAPAIPSAAPAPDVLNPKLKTPDSLPPLTLPPDIPVAPAPPVEVKSSPLTGAARELKVNVFPATCTAVANGLCKVGFYNHTARDLSLTIEGKTLTLPAMSYVHAQLPPSFTWRTKSIGLISRSGSSELTNVPSPWRLSRMFSAMRARIASRSEGRLTPSVSAAL